MLELLVSVEGQPIVSLGHRLSDAKQGTCIITVCGCRDSICKFIAFSHNMSSSLFLKRMANVKSTQRTIAGSLYIKQKAMIDSAFTMVGKPHLLAPSRVFSYNRLR